MTDRNVSGRFWAIVTLAAAVISSPLWVRFGPERTSSAVDAAVTQGAIPSGPNLPGSHPRKDVAPVLPIIKFVPEGSVAPLPPPPPPPVASLDPSQTPIGEVQLFGMSLWDLEVLRNTIYARHGRRFERVDLQRYFDGQSWYRPVYELHGFPDSVLSPVERYNAHFILNYQRRVYGVP
jgi:hypothetical protein